MTNVIESVLKTDVHSFVQQTGDEALVPGPLLTKGMTISPGDPQREGMYAVAGRGDLMLTEVVVPGDAAYLVSTRELVVAIDDAEATTQIETVSDK